MSRHTPRRHGVLIRIRRARHRQWAALIALAALCLSPWTPGEATVTVEGDVFPALESWGALAFNIRVGFNGPGALTVDGGSALSIGPPGRFLVVGSDRAECPEGHGTVVIDGEGSSVTFAGATVIVGRCNSATTGSLTIANGGALSTTNLQVGVDDETTPSDVGATGTVLVDGIGSSLTLSGFGTTPSGGNIGRNQGHATVTLRNGATMGLTAVGATSGGPGFTVGFGGATGIFNIQSGASMTLDGTGVTGGTGPGFTVGNNGTGALIIDDASLSIIANPFGGGMTIGINGGTGTVTFENGADFLFSGVNQVGGGFNLGRTAGSAGTLNVTTGAALTLNATTGGGGFNIGDAGTGMMTVSGAGTSILQDGLTATASPFTTLGNQATGSGTLTIEDGATLTIHRSGGSAATCCMTVGRLGHGELRILNGGKLIIDDDSDATNFRLTLGGNGTSGTGGTYDALISGAGSELTLTGKDATFTLGRAPDGPPGPRTLVIEDGATVNADLFHVGWLAGSSATMNVSGGGTTINLVGDADGAIGAGFSVGAGGTGTLTVAAGAVITVDGSATTQATGFSVGGSQTTLAGGTGTLVVDGAGSRIQILGTEKGLNIGFDNSCLNAGPCNLPSTGTVTVSSGGQILSPADLRGSIGGTPGGTGSVTVTGGGSLLDAGAFLGIAKDRDDNPGGTGTLTVSAGGTVKATEIHIGPGGTLNGNGGTIIGNVVNQGGTVNPGQSPGRLTIIGGYQNLSGTLRLEVDANGNHDVLEVVGPASFAGQIEIAVDPGYQPAGGAVLDLIRARADLAAPPQPLLAVMVSQAGDATAQPEPGLGAVPVSVASEAVPAASIFVPIDVKPGLFPNIINAQSQGPVEVALLSSLAFDARDIDPATITLTGAAVGLVATGDPALCIAEDANDDGLVDLVCHLERAGSAPTGEDTAQLAARTKSGVPVQGSDSITVVDRALVLGGLSPAKVWIGLKNSDAVGLRLDVMAEVYLGPTRVGTGQIDNVPSGSSGFNNAVLHTIPLSLASGPVPFAGGTELKLTVSSRRTCFGGGHNSGTPRLWYNGQAVDGGSLRDAGTRFDATIDGGEAEYFLRSGLALSPVAGAARQFIDKTVNASLPCPGRPFVPFGTWTITP